MNDNGSLNTGILYECIKNEISECNFLNNSTRGYFKETDIYYSNHKYIKCDGISCVQVKTPSSSVTKCKSIGELILNNSEVKLCINSSTMIGFSNKNEESRYIMKNTENGIFGTEENGDYVMISFMSNSIIPSNISQCKINI